MKTFLIKWDAGFGETVQIISAENEEEASKEAYEKFLEEVENNHNTGTVEEIHDESDVEKVIDSYGEDFVDDLRVPRGGK